MITHPMVLGPVLLANATLMLSARGASDDGAWREKALAAVEAAVPQAEKDPTRPVYHFHPPAQWMNDICGAIYYKGYYHVFYQYNPFSGDRWGDDYTLWAHARSKDLVHWEDLPWSFLPMKDRGERRCNSGCITLDGGGRPMIFYTYVPTDGRLPRQQWGVIPLDDDLIQWDRVKDEPLMAAGMNGVPADVNRGWSDPFVFRSAGRTFVTFKSCGGLVCEARDKELTQWTYAGTMEGVDGECPNFFPLDDKWVLIRSTHPLSYIVGDFDAQTVRLKRSGAEGVVDYGFGKNPPKDRSWTRGLYGTNAFADREGRRILLGWICGFKPKRGWNGCMSLPRILTLDKDNHLIQTPAPELKTLRGKHHKIGTLILNSEARRLHDVNGDAMEIMAEFAAADAKAFGLKVRQSEDGKDAVTIRYANGNLNVAGTEVPLKLDAHSKTLKLHVFMDKSVFEVFVNDGATSVTRVEYPGEKDLGVSVFAEDGGVTLKSLDAWEMADLTAQPERSSTPATYECDVCVYGGTASGMMAAVAAAKEGKSVLLVEPSRWLGGIVGGGIRAMCDCLYPQEVGGLTRMMIEEDRKIGGGVHDRQPAFRECFKRLAKEHGIRVLYEHRLGTVSRDGNRITALHLDYAPPANDGCPAPDATTTAAAAVRAQMFIDASYEGDLMALAGVSYVVGRESRAQYGESLAGVRNLRVFDISPYAKPDDLNSGLLPMIDPSPIGEMGSASRHILAYNFRLQFTTDGSRIGEPTNHDEARYALVRRALQIKGEAKPRIIGWPTGNYARTSMISSGIPGRQSDYPDANWTERAKIWREWSDHAKIMHKLTGSTQRLNKGEYPESNDFPNQLYIRLARRMVGRYVMTQHDLMHQTVIDDSIGLAYYKVDIYPCRLVATPHGKVASEGETFIQVCPGPYPISYRALTPKSGECGNLLVPVCMSATHVALSSIRMEPTYMIMGESAGIAAVRAIEEGRCVQDIDMADYRKALVAAAQVLEWDGKGYNNGWDGWWTDHPEDYRKRPLSTVFKGLSPGDPDPRDPMVRYAGWVKWLRTEGDTDGDGLVSPSEWNKGKQGWEWLFPIIDTNKDDQIDAKEYVAFQVYKARNPDWIKKRPKTND